MPIIKSAKKRVKVTAAKSTRNAKTKKGLRHSLKALHAAVTGKKNVESAHSKAQSALDHAVKKGIISKNKAARKKRQLNKSAKAANGGKRTAVAKKAAKPAVKKAVAKKAPAKKKAVAKKK